MWRCIQWAVALTLLLPSLASARTWRISVDRSGDAPTIQAGIDQAANGDTVLVGPGTYMENLSLTGKDLVLRSEFGPEATTLDGSSQQETVVYVSGSTRSTVIEGFTITGGIGHQGVYILGGGLYLDNGASPEVKNNQIFGNGISGSTDSGGGLFTNAPPNSPESPLIINNLFESNISDHGGALFLGYGSSEIRDNVFRNNSSRFDGGAIYSVLNSVGGSASTHIIGNQFWQNSAMDHGGAIQIFGRSNTQFTVQWNLFVQNSAHGSDPGDTGSGGAILIESAPALISNNTFVENVGTGETVCSGGAIAMDGTPTDLYISQNIFAYNRSCGLSCRYTIENTLGPNLFWMNQDGDLGTQLGSYPTEWAANQIFADPQFCDPAFGNYSVSIDSPALMGPNLMGVWTTPGCGPGVSIQPITWGRIKARY